MAAPKWQPGTLYPTGFIVEPVSVIAAVAPTIVNPGFETGNAANYTLPAGASVSNSSRSSGVYSLKFTGVAGQVRAYVTALEPVNPGVQIAASCRYNQGAASSGKNGGSCILRFYDAGSVFLEEVVGAAVTSSSGGPFKTATVSTTVPDGAAFVTIGVLVNRTQSSDSFVDDFAWTWTGNSSGLLFKAVQPALGTSGDSEPTWPIANGVQVVDNTVTWEAFYGSRIVWRAEPILESGAVEPIWPTISGQSVVDNTIRWELVPMHVTDPNCPHSKTVVMVKYKIFAGDKDITKYCATLNATDWSSKEDAGFLGTGIMENGANDVKVLALYRGNLVPMNAPMIQQWQIDPDPALMSQLDTLPGVGSVWQLAAVSLSNDLFYLSQLGVRTLGITGATNNLKAGDVGLPIDPIIQDRVRRIKLTPDEQPIGLYFPSSGQYWLSFNFIAPPPNGLGDNDRDIDVLYRCMPSLVAGQRYAEVFVYTLNQVGQVGAWTRYLFPFAIDYAVMFGDDLLVRDADRVFRINEELGAVDFAVFDEDGEIVEGTPFNAIIQWPWLDMGGPGQDKQMESVEIVGYGRAFLEIGYAQDDTSYFTPEYEMDADTLRGTPVPFPLNAPSYSVRLTYDGWDPTDPDTLQNRFWGFNAFQVNFT